MSDSEGIERGDLEAMAAARAELGRDYEPALLEGFADRVEAALERRIAEAVRATQLERGLHRVDRSGQQLALAIISLVAAIPISIVLGVNDQLMALLVAWAGIVGVNLAHAWQGRR